MGQLSDEPSLDQAESGDGDKFIRMFSRVFDDEDRAMVRAWGDAEMPPSEIHRRLRRGYPNFPISRSTVERGIARLKACQWEC